MSLQSDPAARDVVRHLVATLAYRAAKVLRDVPDFATRAFGDSTRVPVAIVAHLGDLMAWGISIARGGNVWKPEGGRDWRTEVDRFFAHLSTIDRELASEMFAGSIDMLIQGPRTDKPQGARTDPRQLSCTDKPKKRLHRPAEGSSHRQAAGCSHRPASAPLHRQASESLHRHA
jgi:hypothetical protein